MLKHYGKNVQPYTIEER